MGPLQDVRLGVALVRLDTSRAAELISKIEATLRAMELVLDELQQLGRARTDLAGICRAITAEATQRNPDRAIILNTTNQACGNWDGERMDQVVRTLLSNALRAGAPDKPVELTVVDHGNRVLLAVANRGEPIEGGELDICGARKIVEAHFGSLEVDSDEFRTVFRVTLPKRPEVSAPRRSNA